MSAIAGVLRGTIRSGGRDEVAGMLSAMRRRGPHGTVVREDGPVAIGTALLRSSDAAPAFAHDPASGMSVVADARIDNRPEIAPLLGLRESADGGETSADVILRAYARWGDGCPERLLGDFAFVVWDGRERRLFAARDHLGARPLVYHAGPGLFAFASEPAALLDVDGVPDAPNETRIADLLVGLEHADATSTLWQAIHRLPPAHRLVCQDGAVGVAPYWTPAPGRWRPPKREAEQIEAFRKIFADAVRCRLGGRVGSMLSGGLDSSVIVGFGAAIRAAEGSEPLRTLSVVSHDPASCEETRFIRAVQAIPGLDPMDIQIESLADLASEIRESLDSTNDPFDGPMLVPALAYHAARRCGLTAVLDGVDGDLVASHEPDLIASLLRAGAWGSAIRESRQMASFYRDYVGPWGSPIRLLTGGAARAFAPAPARVAWRWARRKRDVRAFLGDSIIRPEFARRVGIEERIAAFWASNGGPVAADPSDRQAKRLGQPLVGVALERYDRVASAFGIEARHPFLDKRVVECALALPWGLKVRDGWTKWVVRRSAEGILPPEVVWRRGRWVHLGPRVLGSVLRSPGAAVSRTVEGGLAPLETYLDSAKLLLAYDLLRRSGDLAAGETVWLAARLGAWLDRQGSRMRRPRPPSRENEANSRHPVVG